MPARSTRLPGRRQQLRCPMPPTPPCPLRRGWAYGWPLRPPPPAPPARALVRVDPSARGPACPPPAPCAAPEMRHRLASSAAPALQQRHAPPSPDPVDASCAMPSTPGPPHPRAHVPLSLWLLAAALAAHVSLPELRVTRRAPLWLSRPLSVASASGSEHAPSAGSPSSAAHGAAPNELLLRGGGRSDRASRRILRAARVSLRVGF